MWCKSVNKHAVNNFSCYSKYEASFPHEYSGNGTLTHAYLLKTFTPNFKNVFQRYYINVLVANLTHYTLLLATSELHQFCSQGGMLLAILLTLSFSFASAIDWNGNNWAFGCDFDDNDLSNVQIRGEDCGQKCVDTDGCTHFTWTTYNGGTCWMKSGSVSQGDAKETNDNSMVCGITSSIIIASNGHRGGKSYSTTFDK